MLRERSQTFKLAFIAFDLFLAAFSFFTAVVLHFFVLSPDQILFVVPDMSGLFAPGRVFTDTAPVLLNYAYLGIVVSAAQVIVFIATDLYHPRRGLSYLREFLAIVRGVFLSLVVVLALTIGWRVASVVLWVTVGGSFSARARLGRPVRWRKSCSRSGIVLAATYGRRVWRASTTWMN